MSCEQKHIFHVDDVLAIFGVRWALAQIEQQQQTIKGFLCVRLLLVRFRRRRSRKSFSLVPLQVDSLLACRARAGD